MLHSRQKWTESKKNIAVDDIVILTDETTPRYSWSLARVIGIEKSGLHVRKAIVRRSDGKIFTKDRNKLVYLELNGIENEKIQ